MYRQLCCHFWTDPKVRALSSQDKLLFIYLITCPQSHFSGIYYLPAETIKIETGIRVGGYPIDTLSIPCLALFDVETSTVWVKNMLKYQWVGKTHVTAIERHLKTLHYSQLIAKFLEFYAEFSIPYRYPIDTLSGGYRYQEQEQNKEQEQEQNPPNPPKGNGVPFDQFWKFYPRKEARHMAMKAWVKVSPDESVWNDMLAWIEKALTSEQWQDKSKIPHPATWLNQRRWEGDPPPSSRERGKQESIADWTSRILEERSEEDNS
jgi:hypothetical protein